MRVVVFDTETVGCNTQTLMNVGYAILELNENTAEAKVLCEKDYIVNDIISNRLLMLNDMFVGAEKWTKYLNNISKGGTKCHTITKIFSIMQNDLLKYKVEYGFAYNCGFDTDKFEKTAREYGVPNPLGCLKAIHDIWGYAYHFICSTDDYIDYCKRHELFTETKRFIQTSVEGVTAYLTDTPTFVEEHTALDDVGWEIKILQEVIRRGCDITKPMRRGKNIPSGKVFHKRLTINGQVIDVNFTRMSRKWDNSENIEFIDERNTESEGGG